MRRVRAAPVAGAIGRDPAAFQIDLVEAVLARELLEIDQIHAVAAADLVAVHVHGGAGAFEQILADDAVGIDRRSSLRDLDMSRRRPLRQSRKRRRDGSGELKAGGGGGGGGTPRQQGRTAQDQATSGKPHATPLAR